jgi:hypothetical protein|tara:strand:+ start:158 stop:604 length:447 start_codon:yes stop_codon:yes gene_type:complete
MKINYCFIGLVFLFSGFYMSFLNKDTEHFQKFNNLLDAGQKEKYDSIVRERLLIYIGGSILGSGLAYYYYLMNKDDKYLICKLLVISHVVKLGFYYFFPKSPLMLYSLRTKEQTDAWADIYQEMKHRWIMSLVFGLFAYIFLSLALIK